MFAKREPAALRLRLASLQEEHKLGRLPVAAFRSQAVEVIVALKKLGEEVRGGIMMRCRLAGEGCWQALLCRTEESASNGRSAAAADDTAAHVHHHIPLCS